MVNQIGSYCGPPTTPLSFFSRICRLRRQMREKKETFAERFVVAANLIHHLDKRHHSEIRLDLPKHEAGLRVRTIGGYLFYMSGQLVRRSLLSFLH